VVLILASSGRLRSALLPKNIPKLLVKSKILCYSGKGVEVILLFAGIAQLVEQRIENPRVRSSNLRPGIIKNPALCRVFGCLWDELGHLSPLTIFIAVIWPIAALVVFLGTQQV
jgi:hypothetical protein